MTPSSCHHCRPPAPVRSISRPLLNKARALGGALLCLVLAAACQPAAPPDTLPGYAEAEFTYVAAPVGGHLQTLAVSKGQQVKPGQALFALDPQPEAARRQESAGRLAQAQDRLADLRKGLRPSELDSLQAQLKQAQVAARLSQAELARRRKLHQEKSLPREQLDQAQARYLGDRARVDELEARLVTARLGARPDQIEAARAEIKALEAVQAAALWALGQKEQKAPAGGLVQDTFFHPGEWVPAGRPVVALLEPAHLKVRFFVPQARAAGLALGQKVRVAWDGASGPLSLPICYVSPQVEYTPPVIYSAENRAKLVFMVEAGPLPAGVLHPGQPVTVGLAPAESAQ